MRFTYIVCYDICDQKRLRKVFQTMKNWGQHIQYSIFECQLTDADRVQIESELGEIIHHRQDQILFIKLGKAESRGDREITSLGKAYSPYDQSSMVI